MNWNVGDDSNIGYILSASQVNPQYILCKRYYPTLPNEKRWFGELITEVISVDGALFPEEEQIALSEEQAMNISIEGNYQVLRVFCMLDENGILDILDIAEQDVRGFKFCGFDLSDFWVSAILNCGSFMKGNYLSKAFDYRELNEFGLVSDYQSAVKIRQKLMDEYPDDDHAYCAVFAIWRKILKLIKSNLRSYGEYYSTMIVSKLMFEILNDTVVLLRGNVFANVFLTFYD